MQAPTDLRHLLDARKSVPACIERRLVQKETLPPHSVEMHLTSTCNYNCRHCSYAQRNQAGSFLNRTIINQLLEDITSPELAPKGIYCSGGGEPTTLKGWEADLQYIAKAGISTALVTNGALITEKHAAHLTDISYVAVSIYSTDETAYRAISGGNNFSAQWTLPSLIRQHAPHSVVGARCVINTHNHDHIPSIFAQAMQSGYDYVIFIPEIDYEARGIALTRSERETLRRICATEEFNPAKTNLAGLLQNEFSYYKPYSDIQTACSCASIRYRLNAFVNYDGGIWLCQPHIGNDTFCIGNLNDSRFSEIWNSPRHLSVIEKLEQNWENGDCENCRSISSTRAWHQFETLPANTPMTIIKDPFL